MPDYKGPEVTGDAVEEVVRVVLSAMASETASGYELKRARLVPFCKKVAEGIAEFAKIDLEK